jgi:hypothetical protein
MGTITLQPGGAISARRSLLPLIRDDGRSAAGQIEARLNAWFCGAKTPYAAERSTSGSCPGSANNGPTSLRTGHVACRGRQARVDVGRPGVVSPSPGGGHFLSRPIHL